MLVEGTRLIPICFARGYTRVPGLHCPRTLAVRVEAMRVLVREIIVENIITNAVVFTTAADDGEVVCQSIQSRQLGGHHL